MKIDKNWTLFLDRDGVINVKLENEYVREWSDFIFKKKSIEALVLLSSLFTRIIIVTNQRGVGRGLMTEQKLNSIHSNMLDVINSHSGRIDRIYYSIGTLDSDSLRKPNIGMAIMAKNDFPEIDFQKSVMIGDSLTDLEFGRKLKMKTIFICDEENYDSKLNNLADYTCSSLMDAYYGLKKNLL